MTEQIKSAINALEMVDKYGCPIGCDNCEKSVTLAIRSLKAWEEVMTELEKVKEDVMELNIEYYLGELAGLKMATDIINKHLADLPQTR